VGLALHPQGEGGLMSSVTIAPRDLGPAFTRLAAFIPEMEVDLHKGLHNAMRKEVERASPVGSRSKRRGDRVVGPGEYRGSHASSIGSPSGGGSLASLRHGHTSYLFTSAVHGLAIERGTRAKRYEGRQRSRSGNWYRRIQGSPQAPGGVYIPARRKLRSVQERIAAAIVAEYERRIAGAA
jgi:hypothetical protein